MNGHMKQVSRLLAVTVVVAAVLSAWWRIPYIFTFVAAAALAFAGHVVTIDDDLSGGWSNPDGLEPFPWRGLLLKAVVLVILGALALVPQVRALGR
jgi:hypothetical protein